ncbi:MAG: hypothetical protein ACLF0G_15745 [Candidatus Brocadiia bacterium]
MADPTIGSQNGALRWVRTIGWQLIALAFVLLGGLSFYRLASVQARRAEAQAQAAEDLAKFTSFVAQCLPTGTEDDLRRLIADATDFAVHQGRENLREAMWRKGYKPSYGAPELRQDVPGENRRPEKKARAPRKNYDRDKVKDADKDKAPTKR